MKKREFKTIEEETLVNVSDEEIVKEFISDFYTPFDWMNEYTNIEDFDYFFEDYAEVTQEDKTRIIDKIREKANLLDNEYKEDEAKQLENRRDILDFLEMYIDVRRDYMEPGDVGYILSTEEILDLILENGNK